MRQFGCRAQSSINNISISKWNTSYFYKKTNKMQRKRLFAWKSNTLLRGLFLIKNSEKREISVFLRQNMMNGETLFVSRNHQTQNRKNKFENSQKTGLMLFYLDYLPPYHWASWAHARSGMSQFHLLRSNVWTRKSSHISMKHGRTSRPSWSRWPRSV